MPLPQEVPGTSFAHSALAKAHFVAPSLPQGEAGGGRGSGWAALTTYPLYLSLHPAGHCV